MKVKYTSANGALQFELEAAQVVDLFENIAMVQEVFEVATKCGHCNGTDLRYAVRNVDDNKYYEVHCQVPGCRARFAFGQNKKGGNLFPKRKDKDGEWIKNGGWTKWEGRGDSHTESVGSPPSHYHPEEPAYSEPPFQAPPPSRSADFRRELPKELAANFARIQKDRTQFGSVCLKISENMMCRDSRRGQEAYDSVLRAVDRKFPKGIREVSDMREVLIDLWEAAESLGEVSAGKGFGV